MQTETATATKIELMLDEVRRDIARGSAYLDDVSPGWHDEIDTETLDLNSGDHCVLGQLPIGSRVFEQYSISWLSDHGFWFPGGDSADYDVLTTEWVRHIEQARGATID